MKQKYDVDGKSFESIAHNFKYRRNDFLSCGSTDGFIPIIQSIPPEGKIAITGPTKLHEHYTYNKEGKVKRDGRDVKVIDHRITASVDGKRYDVYIPNKSIIASRVEELGEEDDLIFYSVKEACEHFGVVFNTIKAALKSDGVRQVKGYLFQYGWPMPYLIDRGSCKKGGKDEK